MNKRKVEVVQHALVLFREKGIIQTSIQDIIECSSISKGTFYNYFKNKNECIYAAIEYMRYEASLIRSDIQLGKPLDDLDVLVEQIVQISQMNQQYGLPALFEQMLFSMDKELKEYVMLYRIHEVAWLSNRVVDIYGEAVRLYAFEVATLFYGMLTHIKFLQRILVSAVDVDDASRTVKALVSYLDPLLAHITTHDSAVLNQEQIEKLLQPIVGQRVKVASIIDEIEQLKRDGRLTKPQQQLLEGLGEELLRVELRTAVISALLPSLVKLFRNTEQLDQIKHINTQIWLYLNEYN